MITAVHPTRGWGRLWTDRARMETWRRVEVAACEELPELLGDEGPSPSELRGDPQLPPSRWEAVNERELVTDHDLAAFVDVLGGLSRGGRGGGSTSG